MDEASDGQENPAGTIIRCYENLCVSDLGDRGSVYARADLQLSEAVRRPKFMTAGFFRFVQLAEVGKSLKNDVDCMLLTIAGCKAFACKDVVIHRYDRSAAAAKQAAQGYDGSGFAVCVEDSRTVVIVNNAQMLILKVAAYRGMSSLQVFAVLGTSNSYLVAVIQLLGSLDKASHQLIAANGRIAGCHIGTGHALVPYNAAGDGHIAGMKSTKTSSASGLPLPPLTMLIWAPL